MHVYLETARLTLRRLTLADVDNLVALDSDPAVMRYLSGGTPTPREVIAHEILPRFLGYYQRYDGYGVWAAIEKASGDFLGWFSFHPHDDGNPGEVALGYRLRRAAWGQGYATEGARALIRKGFTELGAQRVVATTYQDNLASRRVLEKAGLTLVRAYRLTPADLRSANTFSSPEEEIWDGDELEYALLKTDWEEQEEAARARGTASA